MSKFRKNLDIFVSRVDSLKARLTTEEATKMALVAPFINLLGYDVFNPLEVLPEYIADVGIKKGERVDYAILKDNNPIMLIEAKCVGESLDNNYNQLYRYFSTTSSKFAILTDGVIYRFYSDIEEVNKMDFEPFIEINLLNLSENDKMVLEYFRKDKFDLDSLYSNIVKLKYSSQIRNTLEAILSNPSDDFIRLLSNSNEVSKYRPIVEELLKDYGYRGKKAIKPTKSTNTDIVTVGTYVLPLNEFNYKKITKEYVKVKPIALCVNNEELPLKTWKSFLVLAMDYLYKTNKVGLTKFIDVKFKYQRVLLYSNLDTLKEKYTISADFMYHKLDDNVYMYSNYSTSRATEFLLEVLSLLNLPMDYFKLKYSTTSI